MTQFLRHFLLAVQFFTRIPVTGRLAAWVGFSPAMLRASAAHFPAIGMLIGGAAAACFALLQSLLPDSSFTPLVAASLSTVLTVWLTGGFHEDGLADVADGLGGSYDRARALEIMKDSRVGAFGAMALALALLSKVALLALLGTVETLAAEGLPEPLVTFGGAYVCAAIWGGHIVSRTLPLVLVRLLPHVGDTATSKSKPLADQIGPGGLAVAFAWCFGGLALASLVLDAINLIVGCGLAVLALLALLRFFRRRLQGFTGDCLGCAQQVCEIAFYLGLAVSL